MMAPPVIMGSHTAAEDALVRAKEAYPGIDAHMNPFRLSFFFFFFYLQQKDA
jgi:hypothetical protein